ASVRDDRVFVTRAEGGHAARLEREPGAGHKLGSLALGGCPRRGAHLVDRLAPGGGARRRHRRPRRRPSRRLLALPFRQSALRAATRTALLEGGREEPSGARLFYDFLNSSEALSESFFF